jgi:hypothetical protein
MAKPTSNPYFVPLTVSACLVLARFGTEQRPTNLRLGDEASGEWFARLPAPARTLPKSRSLLYVVGQDPTPSPVRALDGKFLL